MSKADTLGTAPAFGAARGARSSRRTAIERTIGGDNAGGAAITELPVTVVSENPDNPRNHLRNLDETTESVRELGVILPIVVATVEAYLHDRPDRADDLDDGAQYVVIDGHRRLEASRRVGLATIPVRVDNARVATDESLLEAAFVANYHRDDMTDLEEAHALKQLVDYYGSQTKAAKRLGIPQATLSSKLSLLKLSPELQKDLMTGERSVEHVRNLGKLAPEEQRAKADERALAAQRKAPARQDPPPDTPPPVAASPAGPTARPEGPWAGPANYHGVIIPGGGDQQPSGALADRPQETAPQKEPGTAVVSASAPESIPEQRPEPIPEGRKLPYDDGVNVARHLILKMPTDAFVAMLRVMNQHAAEHGLNVAPERTS
ncbi:ParB/RepB/Spo0J family partition protein [Streptomyces griseorubiginosus]|uniref:ParB/RepB/Spo0J family partition protein n=1 Tax=Streptomyces griseorubiginosus TaxID=67304 RepID=UPI0033CE757C